MIIELVKDSKVRYCAICKKQISKGDPIIKYDEIIDVYKNTRKCFTHIDCMINKLKVCKKEFEKEKKKIPKLSFKIERVWPNEM